MSDEILTDSDSEFRILNKTGELKSHERSKFRVSCLEFRVMVFL